jgi:hypothetical protein
MHPIPRNVSVYRLVFGQQWHWFPSRRPALSSAVFAIFLSHFRLKTGHCWFSCNSPHRVTWPLYEAFNISVYMVAMAGRRANDETERIGQDAVVTNRIHPASAWKNWRKPPKFHEYNRCLGRGSNRIPSVHNFEPRKVIGRRTGEIIEELQKLH